MRFFVAFFVLAGCCTGAVQVRELLESTQAALKAGTADADIARAVSQTALSERLDLAVVEELQSRGAGPQTVEALEKLRWLGLKLVPASGIVLFDAPALPSVAEREAVIAVAREEALRYTSGLPDFICTQTVSRFEDAKFTQNWKALDRLKVATAYNGKAETYKLLEVNGKATTKDFRKVGGFRSSGEFGGTLRAIFRETSQTEFQWERWSRLRGRMAYVFSYRVAKAHSTYGVGFSTLTKKGRVTAGMVGSVWIDRQTKRVLRLTSEAEELPADWPIRSTPSMMDYDWADVGGVAYLLPRRIDSRVIRVKNQRRNVTEFSEYKKFSAEATVSFEAAP